MELILSGGLLSLTSLYFFHKNAKSYENRILAVRNLKNKTKIIEASFDANLIKNIPDFTPVFITSKIIPNREVLDQNLNIEFNSPVVFREVYMYQVKEDASVKKENENNTRARENQNQSGNNINESSSRTPTREYIWSKIYQKGKDNPHFPFTSAKFICDKISVGPFEFNSKFIDNYLKPNKMLELSNKQCLGIPLPWVFSDLIEDQHPKSGSKKTTKSLKHSHSFYDGKYKLNTEGILGIISDVKKRNVGDLKVTYYVPETDDISIFGAKEGNTITNYVDTESNLDFFIVKNKKININSLFSELENQEYGYYLMVNILSGMLMFAGLGLGAYGVNSKLRERRN